MNQRKILTCFSLCLAGVTTAQAAKPKAPNIIFIMSDDHTSQAVGAYGGMLASVMPTPNIDRISKEGVRMDNCFVTNAISTPSRACIITGQYSQKNGVYTLADDLDPNLPNMAKELQQSGYQTAIVGKWHLGSEPSGFDWYNVLPGQGHYYNPQLIKKGDWTKGKNGQPAPTEYKGHSTDVITDEAIKYMESTDRGKPFFLMCHYKAPHRPWQPAERFKNLLEDVEVPEPSNLLDTYEGKGEYTQEIKMSLEYMNHIDLKGEKVPEGLTRDEKRHWIYQRYLKDYLRCVAGIDENVGRLLQYLDEQGLAENTIVMYTGDQGFFLGEHGWFDKRLMYEEALRMPLLIRYPKEIKAGAVNADIVLNIDFAPFLLDCAGIKTPKCMQGESFRKNLTGKTPRNWRQSMYYRYWQHADDAHNATAHYGIRTGRYKLVFWYAQALGMKGTNDRPLTPQWELYDLKNDPAEMHNIYNDPANKDLIADLKKQLLQLKKKYGDEDDKYPVMKELCGKYYW